MLKTVILQCLPILLKDHVESPSEVLFCKIFSKSPYYLLAIVYGLTSGYIVNSKLEEEKAKSLTLFLLFFIIKVNQDILVKENM